MTTKEGQLIVKVDTGFDREKVYARVVSYYIDKKGYDKNRANMIAQKEVEKQEAEYNKNHPKQQNNFF